MVKRQQAEPFSHLVQLVGQKEHVPELVVKLTVHHFTVDLRV